MVVYDLSFFSDDIRVLVTAEKTVFVNVQDFCHLTGADYKFDPALFLEHADYQYLSLSYVMNHLQEILEVNGDLVNRILIQKDFFRLIVLELGIVREEIPRLFLEMEDYHQGFVSYGTNSYILASRLATLFNVSYRDALPDDVPRLPAAVLLKTSFAEKEDVPPVRCDWLIETSSLPYLQDHFRKLRSDSPFNLATFRRS